MRPEVGFAVVALAFRPFALARMNGRGDLLPGQAGLQGNVLWAHRLAVGVEVVPHFP